MSQHQRIAGVLQWALALILLAGAAQRVSAGGAGLNGDSGASISGAGAAGSSTEDA